MKKLLLLSVTAMALLTGCTQESQNQIGRSIQNWTGTDGVLDVYAGGKLVNRFIKVDKLSTGLGRKDNQPRAYRYGYGVMDMGYTNVYHLYGGIREWVEQDLPLDTTYGEMQRLDEPQEQ